MICLLILNLILAVHLQMLGQGQQTSENVV